MDWYLERISRICISALKDIENISHLQETNPNQALSYLRTLLNNLSYDIWSLNMALEKEIEEKKEGKNENS